MILEHAIHIGPASQSFGIQVGKLAGIPQAVIEAAKYQLSTLESNSEIHQLQETPVEQLKTNLISAQKENLLNQIKSIDVDSLSPREALELIYQWQQPLKNKE